MWPFTKKPVEPPKPLWTYVGHERTAIDTAKNAHIYRVDFRRGLEDRAETFYFHASSLDPKSDAKLVRYFQSQADKLNGN